MVRGSQQSICNLIGMARASPYLRMLTEQVITANQGKSKYCESQMSGSNRPTPASQRHFGGRMSIWKKQNKTEKKNLVQTDIFVQETEVAYKMRCDPLCSSAGTEIERGK